MSKVVNFSQAKESPRKTKPVDVHVGMRVRMRREMLEMSREALAVELNVTQQQIHKYETAAARISAARLFEIAKILGVNLTFFFEGLGDPDASGSAQAVDLEQEKACEEVVGLVRGIESPQKRDTIVGVVRLLAND